MEAHKNNEDDEDCLCDAQKCRKKHAADPFLEIIPSVGSSSPAISFCNVVLPAPLGANIHLWIAGGIRETGQFSTGFALVDFLAVAIVPGRWFRPTADNRGFGPPGPEYRGNPALGGTGARGHAELSECMTGANQSDTGVQVNAEIQLCVEGLAARIAEGDVLWGRQIQNKIYFGAFSFLVLGVQIEGGDKHLNLIHTNCFPSSDHLCTSHQTLKSTGEQYEKKEGDAAPQFRSTHLGAHTWNCKMEPFSLPGSEK